MSSSPLRTSIIVSAIIFTAIGMGLSIAALLSPSWQVVNLQEYNSVHEHGLWLDCIRHIRDVTGVLLRRYSGTFDLEDDNSPVGEVNRHKFYGWHTATLIMIIIALITGFCSICIGACSCAVPSLTLIFTTTILLTTFLSSVAEGVFFFFSHRADNRFVKGIVGTYEQRVGLAFFLQMGACFFHFIAFLIAMMATLATNLSDQSRPLLRPAPPPPPQSHSRPGSSTALQNFDYMGHEETPQGSLSLNSGAIAPPLPPHNYNNLRNTQQQYAFPAAKSASLRHESSTEFDHQIFTQEQINQQPTPKTRSQYYSRQNERFERVQVADSMPELSGRISQKSETCV
uniref:Clc-like protein n=1 Tax=Meloidogyne hapla TaxID=6305 RepID=A0A1I8BGS6_MELHA